MTDQQMEQITREFRELRQHMDRRFEHMDRRFEHVDRRFEHVDGRLGQFDKRLEGVDEQFGQLDLRLQKIEVQFEGHRIDLKLLAEQVRIGHGVTNAKLDGLKELLERQIDPLRTLAEDHEKRLKQLEGRAPAAS